MTDIKFHEAKQFRRVQTSVLGQKIQTAKFYTYTDIDIHMHDEDRIEWSSSVFTFYVMSSKVDQIKLVPIHLNSRLKSYICSVFQHVGIQWSFCSYIPSLSFVIWILSYFLCIGLRYLKNIYRLVIKYKTISK